MSDVVIIPSNEVPIPTNGGSDNLLSNLMEQAAGTVVSDPTPSPQSTPAPAPAPQDSPEPAPVETIEEDTLPDGEEGTSPENEPTEPKVEDEKPRGQHQSAAAGKRFAEMRVQLREQTKTISELTSQLEALKENPPASEDVTNLKKEVETYKGVLNAFAYQTSDQYKTEVSQPFEKASTAISSLAPSVTQDALNEVALNGDLDDFDRENAYEEIATEAGLQANEISKFVRLAKVRDAAIAKATEFKEKADTFREKFLSEIKGDGKYEVDLTNYTNDAFKAEAESFGLKLDDEGLSEIVKQGRHLAHKIDNASFMKAAILPKVVDALEDARSEIAELNKKIAKLRASNPSATKGVSSNTAPAPAKAPESKSPRSVEDLFGEAMKMSGF